MPCRLLSPGTRQPDVRCEFSDGGGSVKRQDPPSLPRLGAFLLARRVEKPTMPMMLFWLPTIFIGAFFELARIACESTERSLALSGGGMLPGDPLSADASAIRQIVKNSVNCKGRSGDTGEGQSQHPGRGRCLGQNLTEPNLTETDKSQRPAGAQRPQLRHELVASNQRP